MSLNQYSQFAQKMIGLNRQIFRLNNVRTFFLSVSNTSPNKSNWNPTITDETKTKKRWYQMTSAGDNVRVIIVQNELLKSAFCSIRVGVGSEDDPQDCQGLAHLLEHVICRTYQNKMPNHMGYDCVTMDFETKFTFPVPIEKPALFICAWTNIMFSDKHIKKDIMKQERNLVDNEYHGKRNVSGYTANRTVEILKQKKDITLAQFGCGNLKTLRRINDHQLMEELEKLRKLYRQRPLNVCVYSPKKIEMSEVQNSLNFNGSITKEERKEAEEPNWQKRLKSVEAQHLIVQQSADDSIKLDIIYPFHKKLSLDEEDTFTILGDLITKKFEGQLGHVLFEKKIATDCRGRIRDNSLIVTIWLTADRMKRIAQVTRMVHDYFQFLHDNWQKIDPLIKPLIESNRETIYAKSGQDYADSIARCLGRGSDTFDEEDLFRPLSPVKGQQLITEQILNNKCIQHTIAARNVDDVCAANAALVAKGTIEIEEIFDEKFYFLETGFGWFAAPSNFTLPQLTPELNIIERIDLPVNITVPNHEAFLALCKHYLELKTANLIEPYNLKEKGKYGIYRRRDGSISLKLDSKDINKYSKKNHPETEIEFKYYKQSLMEYYSLIMTDSKSLASSLLYTALGNATGNLKRDSVPLQYNVLKDMDFSGYNHHFASYKKEIEHEELSEEFNDKFVIKSINVDESSTVTLAFLQQTEGTDDDIQKTEVTDDDNLENLAACLYAVLLVELCPDLYTSLCNIKQFGAVKGILLTLVSVEEKKLQTGAEILKLLEEKMEPLVLKEIDKLHLKPKQKEDLRNLWTEMTKRQIIIQIVGHVNGGYPSGSFQTHFEEWFTIHKKDFDRLNEL